MFDESTLSSNLDEFIKSPGASSLLSESAEHAVADMTDPQLIDTNIAGGVI
jgi:hypothetical protein